MNDSGAIVGFMAGAVVFSLIGETIKAKSGQSKPGTDVKIILGGTIGTGLLLLLSEGGGTAATFAKGLAGITLIASVLYNGLPVFAGVSTLTGHLSSAPATTTTKVG